MATAAALRALVLGRGQDGHIGVVEQQFAKDPAEAVVEVAADCVVAAVDSPHAVLYDDGSKSDP